MIRVGGVDGAEDVHVYAMALQHVEAGDHLVEGGLTALVDAVGIVHLAWSVDAHAHQESVLGEEGRPLVGDQRGVGLDRVFELHARSLPALGDLDRPPEEIDAHQRRLAPLPGNGDLGGGVRIEQLADVGLEHLVAHPEPVARVQRLLGKEEAIRAVEVADCPGGLRQHVELGRRAQRSSRRVKAHHRRVTGRRRHAITREG